MLPSKNRNHLFLNHLDFSIVVSYSWKWLLKTFYRFSSFENREWFIGFSNKQLAFENKK